MKPIILFLSLLLLAVSRNTRALGDAPLSYFVITDLSNAPSNGLLEGRSINKNGDVVGAFGSEACVWRRGRLTHLPMANHPGYYTDYLRPLAEAFGINSAGQVVGRMGVSAQTAGDDNNWHVALWRGRNPEDLGEGEAFAINDRGQVLIRSEVKGSYLWQHGHRVLLDGGHGNALNNRGIVVGSTGEGNMGHSLLWQDRKVKIIDKMLRGHPNDATAINDRGQVLIVALFGPKQNVAHSYLWEKGRLREIGQFRACGINNQGEVVGGKYLWQKGHLYQINDMIPPEDRDPFLSATAINDRGQIVVEAMLQNQRRLFLLTPTPKK